MTIVGTLDKQFFGGDVWVLQADSGATYQLEGKIPGALKGKKVKVKGQTAKAQFGFSMVGEVLEVSSIKAA